MSRLPIPPVRMREVATEIAERVQTLHWGKCRCKGCLNMIRKRAEVILQVLEDNQE